MSAAPRPDAPLRLGVSSCLLGEAVRFDGGHKRDPFLTDLLGPFVEWVPVCPEVEVGMGIPRPAIRLERARGGVRLVDPKRRIDHTRAMRVFAAQRVAQLRKLDLSGYVLKKNSPSCGMERVPVWPSEPRRPPEKAGRGLFAAALIERLPLLPVEEEGRLHDPRLRENFVERCFAYRRLRELFTGRWRSADLVAFHTAHKLLILAHEPRAYAALGRLVAQAGSLARAELRRRYSEAFMQALAVLATPRRHVNVLLHVLGYFRKRLDADARAELSEQIEDYRRGLVPLIVPITLIRHHVRALGIGYLAGQIYLDPHPRELMLRNHV